MKPVDHWEGAIRPQAGGSLDPRDIVGRDALVDELFDLLQHGVPVLVTDPRRMGKTCLLDRVVFRTRDPWTTVKIDYEGVTTVDEFLRRTIEALRTYQSLRSRVVDSVKALLDNVEVEAGHVTVAAAFRSRPASDLLETALSRIDDRLLGDELLVLALDEVPLAIENIAKAEGPGPADALLQALRRLRQRHRSRIRWIVTGSIGFHHVLRLAGTTEGAINDFESVLCGPLDQDMASVLATKLLHGIEVEFGDEAVHALVEASGGIPFLSHYLAHALRGVEGTCTATQVRAAWRGFVQDRDRSRAMTHLLTRIDDYYGNHTPLAYRVLDLTAMADGPLAFPALVAALHAEDQLDIVRQIVDDLVDDHYLSGPSTGLRWRYDVLREIWIVRRRLEKG